MDGSYTLNTAKLVQTESIFPDNERKYISAVLGEFQQDMPTQLALKPNKKKHDPWILLQLKPNVHTHEKLN